METEGEEWVYQDLVEDLTLFQIEKYGIVPFPYYFDDRTALRVGAEYVFVGYKDKLGE